MMSRIGGSVSGGNWKYAHGTAHYGRNFSVKWLKVTFIYKPNGTKGPNCEFTWLKMVAYTMILGFSFNYCLVLEIWSYDKEM